MARILNPGKNPGAHPYDILKRVDSEELAFWLHHSVLDSPIDADKLDYLRRDAQHCGLEYAFGADVQRFLQSLTSTTKAPATSDDPFIPTIAITRKGVLPVESVLVARYQMFSSVYWHHTARAVTSILQYLAWRYLIPRSSQPNEGSFLLRRSTLLEKFRELPDETALKWLSNQVGRAQGSDLGSRRNLDRLSMALIERVDLPVAIFDVSHAELIERSRFGTVMERRLNRILALHERLSSLDPLTYSQLRERVIKRTCRELQSAALAKGANRDQASLDESVLFPDVPLGSKDQVRNIWVVDQPAALSIFPSETQATLPIVEQDSNIPQFTPTVPGRHIPETYHVAKYDKHSPMALAVGAAFQIWSRRLRIFVLRAEADMLTEILGRSELRRHAFQALSKAYDGIARSL